MARDYSEDQLVEQTAIGLFAELDRLPVSALSFRRIRDMPPSLRSGSVEA